MQIKRWSKEEDIKLITLKKTYTHKEISVILARPLHGVKRRYRMLKGSRRKIRAGKKRYYEKVGKYNRIEDKTKGFQNRHHWKRWTEEEIDQLKKLTAQKLPDYNIHKILSRSVSAIYNRKRLLK